MRKAFIVIFCGAVLFVFGSSPADARRSADEPVLVSSCTQCGALDFPVEITGAGFKPHSYYILRLLNTSNAGYDCCVAKSDRLGGILFQHSDIAVSFEPGVYIWEAYTLFWKQGVYIKRPTGAVVTYEIIN